MSISIVLNFVKTEEDVIDKDTYCTKQYSTKEVTPTKKMNGDNRNIQRTGPNGSNLTTKYFDYDSIQRKNDDVSSRQ